jgi:hypothetical protein
MVTEELPCTVTPCVYRWSAIDMPYRCHTQLLALIRISGRVPSPVTS